MIEAPIIETDYDDLNPIEEVISQRRSLRGFPANPAPREIIERIRHLAGRRAKWHEHAALDRPCADRCGFEARDQRVNGRRERPYRGEGGRAALLPQHGSLIPT